jgi:hypothetical protein
MRSGPQPQRVLSRSSFVRFPALVVRRDAYQQAGSFDESVGGFADVDMWRRVFGVGYAQAAIPTIYPQPHDIPMDMVVTEDGVVRPEGAQ